MYGTLRHNVPNIFHGYISWFSGDAVDLSPTPRRVQARRLIEMMGGCDAVFSKAKEYFEADDPQFAAELTTLILRIDPNNQRTRDLKAAAFRRLGYAQANSTWRSWYLTAARELEGEFDIEASWKDLMANVRGTGNLEGLPTARVLELLRYSVAAEEAGATNIKLLWEISDLEEIIFTELRRGILDISAESGPMKADATLKLKRRDLDALICGSLEVSKAIKDGTIGIEGSQSAVDQFFSCLEPFDYDVSLSAR
jgi:alkyl sulfatase BDS1-like metallo-beta-lactamase superfamily hydrolase